MNIFTLFQHHAISLAVTAYTDVAEHQYHGELWDAHMIAEDLEVYEGRADVMWATHALAQPKIHLMCVIDKEEWFPIEVDREWMDMRQIDKDNDLALIAHSYVEWVQETHPARYCTWEAVLEWGGKEVAFYLSEQ